MRMPGFVRDFLRYATKSLTIIRDNFIPVGAVSQSLGGRSTTEGLASNVVMAPVFWIMRTFTQAVAVVQRREDRDIWKNVRDHPAEMLMDRPNDFYDGDALWKATCVSYVLAGNAYWRKVRNVFGDVIELWYVPHWLIRPVADQTGVGFISHYEYQTGVGPAVRMAPRDVVHFRFGLDPEDPRYGVSQLRPVLREVMTDDQAAQFSEVILRNMGIPGLIVSPKGDAFKPSDDETQKLRDYFENAFSGERRGKPFVMKIPTEISQFGFDPNKLMLASLRDISEERVCATLGLPAAVVGFGSGLQSTKVGATMRELRKLAWVQCLDPMQTSMAKQATAQLLPDFVSHTRRFRIGFDKSGVSAFPEDEALRAAMVEGLVAGGLLRFDRGQEMLGLEVDLTRAFYVGSPEAAAAGVVAAPAAGAAPAPNDPTVDDNIPADDMKALEAIALRRGFITNGNGTHV